MAFELVTEHSAPSTAAAAPSLTHAVTDRAAPVAWQVMPEDMRDDTLKPGDVLKARMTVTYGLLAERGFMLLNDLAGLVRVRPPQLLPSCGVSCPELLRL